MPNTPFHKTMRIWGEEGFFSLIGVALRSKIMNPVTDSLMDKKILDERQVQQRCAERGKLWEYDEPEVKTKVLSRLDNSEIRYRIQKEGYDWSPRRVCELTDAAMLGDRRLFMDSDGNFINDSVRNSTEEQIRSWGLGLRIRAIKKQRGSSNFPLRKPARLETAMSMVDIFPTLNMYGHWLLEYLPMLLHLSVYENETGRRPDIVLRNDPPDWKLESLHILGYPDDRIVEWNDGFAEVERLVLPFSTKSTTTPGRLRMSPVEHRWLRERFLESVDGTDTTEEERFYISRQGLKKRCVTNFEEVRSVLEEFDFEVVRPEEMSVEEQVRRFSRGKFFVGPRGSGLHNTLFAKDASVIEIAPPNTRLHLQFLLDNALGHEYTYMFGSDTPEIKQSKDINFRVNPEVLRSVISRVLSDS